LSSKKEAVSAETIKYRLIGRNQFDGTTLLHMDFKQSSSKAIYNDYPCLRKYEYYLCSWNKHVERMPSITEEG